MKRVLTVLVLLVTVSLFSASVSVPVAFADDPGSIDVPEWDIRSGDLDTETYGPAGDPGGMGTGDGDPSLNGDDLNLRTTGTDSDPGADSDMAEIMLYALSLIQLLAL